MVQKTDNLRIVKNFKRKLKIPINKMIFFGSRIKGNFRENSDFDLMIISENFKGEAWYKRAVPIYMKWNMDYPVDFLCYTPEEFEKKKKQIGIVRQAVKEGIVI